MLLPEPLRRHGDVSNRPVPSPKCPWWKQRHTSQENKWDHTSQPGPSPLPAASQAVTPGETRDEGRGTRGSASPAPAPLLLYTGCQICTVSRNSAFHKPPWKVRSDAHHPPQTAAATPRSRLCTFPPPAACGLAVGVLPWPPVVRTQLHTAHTAWTGLCGRRTRECRSRGTPRPRCWGGPPTPCWDPRGSQRAGCTVSSGRARKGASSSAPAWASAPRCPPRPGRHDAAPSREFLGHVRFFTHLPCCLDSRGVFQPHFSWNNFLSVIFMAALNFKRGLRGIGNLLHRPTPKESL